MKAARWPQEAGPAPAASAPPPTGAAPAPAGHPIYISGAS